jgi:hypothetical protein
MAVGTFGCQEDLSERMVVVELEFGRGVVGTGSLMGSRAVCASGSGLRIFVH